MRRIVLIVPGLLGEPSVLRQKLPTLECMAELGRVFKLQPPPDVETPEALFLGLGPGEGQLRQGPLTVSAFGADPPDRSTHFHLSLMAFEDGIARQPKVEISSEEQGQVMGLTKKLDTKALTIVKGEGLDHGLVWESLGDLRTTPANQLDGQSVRGELPEGDAEPLLRRFIDDSINILSEIELNQRRMDEGLPPLNLLWPWGDGIRKPVPNLAIRRGEPALVISSSLRLQGLARLAGYSHANRSEFGKGLNTRLAGIAERALAEPVTLALIDAVAGFREQGQLEEASWLAHELDYALLAPLFDEALRTPTRITVLSPHMAEASPQQSSTLNAQRLGLGVTYETRDSNQNSTPFDERALEERSLGSQTLWESVAQGVGYAVTPSAHL